MKEKRLKKEQINAIKYFIRKEEEKHKFGDWDRFKISSLKVHANGEYSFEVNWMHTCAGKFEDYRVKGNLFNEFPIYAVFDGLDAVEMLFYKIHRKAYDRSIEYSKKSSKTNDSKFNHLRKIYEPGGFYNKENLDIIDDLDIDDII